MKTERTNATGSVASPWTMLLPIFVFLIGACTKEEPLLSLTEEDFEFHFVSPHPEQIIPEGDTLNIEIHVKGPGVLHGYSALIFEPLGSEFLWSDQEHVHKQELVISGQWINNMESEMPLELHLEVYPDHQLEPIDTAITFTASGSG